MRFTKKDLEIFEINGFADRMQLVVDTVHPKLVKLGELLNPQLSRLVGQQLHTHLAQYAKRTVHAPDETWVAFSPDPSNYKPYFHLVLSVGKRGVQARAVARQDFKDRRKFSENLIAKLGHLSQIRGSREMEDYSRRDAEYRPYPIEELDVFLRESAKKIRENGSASFDVGINLPLSGDLSSHAIQAFSKLTPFYFLGHQLPWTPSHNGNLYY